MIRMIMISILVMSILRPNDMNACVLIAPVGDLAKFKIPPLVKPTAAVRLNYSKTLSVL